MRVMKARVKATGEIVEVIPYNRDGFAYIQDDGETVYEFHELEILDDPDYWTRLEHQYAGMAMQGLMSYVEQITPKKGRSFCDEIVDISAKVAHALVEELKEKEVK